MSPFAVGAVNVPAVGHLKDFWLYKYLFCNPQLLKYLVASERLCALGYDEAQVEEALEMFQNCESKVIPTRQCSQTNKIVKQK